MSLLRKCEERLVNSVVHQSRHTRLPIMVICLAVICGTICGTSTNLVRAETISGQLGIGSAGRIHLAENDFESWTALTIAPDGSWGAATESDTNEAIAKAIANCRKKSMKTLGCGAYTKLMRAKWILAYRCGTEYFAVTHENLANARKIASAREVELRSGYLPSLPACSRLLTIDPRGVVTKLEPGYQF